MSKQTFDPFYSAAHQQRIQELERLWQGLHQLADFAQEFGIGDIFQDNGAKVLQQLVYMNLHLLPGREGNDAISVSGIEWEMKSINLETTASGFSTNHHTNHEILKKFRAVPWSFALYRGIRLDEIYILTPEQLEPIFQHWEEKLNGQAHLNNQKISVSFVREHGVRVFPIDPHNPIDPDSISQIVRAAD